MRTLNIGPDLGKERTLGWLRLDFCYSSSGVGAWNRKQDSSITLRFIACALEKWHVWALLSGDYSFKWWHKIYIFHLFLFIPWPELFSRMIPGSLEKKKLNLRYQTLLWNDCSLDKNGFASCLLLVMMCPFMHLICGSCLPLISEILLKMSLTEKHICYFSILPRLKQFQF